MKAKILTSIGLLTCLFACSGQNPGDEQEVTTIEPDVISKLEVDGQTIEFIRVSNDDEESPIMMTTTGFMNEVNPVEELRQGYTVPLTFAEIYTGLTNDLNIPDELLDVHAIQARDLSREENEFIYPERIASELVEKQTPTSLWYPPVAGHRYTNKQFTTTVFCSQPVGGACSSTQTTRTHHRCNGSKSVKNGIPQEFHCPILETGWMRFAAQNMPANTAQTGTFTGQIFFGRFTFGTPPIAPWEALPAVTIGTGQYWQSDWPGSGNKHWALVVSRAQTHLQLANIASSSLVPN